MKYVYIDGDDIGLSIENCFMSNDEVELTVINKKINSIIKKITSFLQKSDCEIIFSGADGIIFKHEHPDIMAIKNYIKNINSSITFSIGVGDSLRDTFLALRYMKANGKDGLAFFNQEFEIIKN